MLLFFLFYLVKVNWFLKLFEFFFIGFVNVEKFNVFLVCFVVFVLVLVFVMIFVLEGLIGKGLFMVGVGWFLLVGWKLFMGFGGGIGRCWGVEGWWGIMFFGREGGLER